MKQVWEERTHFRTIYRESYFIISFFKASNEVNQDIRLRNLTKDELIMLTASGSLDLNSDGTPDIVNDELLDLNLDNHNDYRRLTEVVQIGPASSLGVAEAPTEPKR